MQDEIEVGDVVVVHYISKDSAWHEDKEKFIGKRFEIVDRLFTYNDSGLMSARLRPIENRARFYEPTVFVYGLFLEKVE